MKIKKILAWTIIGLFLIAFIGLLVAFVGGLTKFLVVIIVMGGIVGLGLALGWAMDTLGWF